MEENTEEVRLFTCRKMDNMKERAEDMSREIRRSTRCVKVEIKKMKAEEYECLDRES